MLLLWISKKGFTGFCFLSMVVILSLWGQHIAIMYIHDHVVMYCTVYISVCMNICVCIPKCESRYTGCDSVFYMWMILLVYVNDLVSVIANYIVKEFAVFVKIYSSVVDVWNMNCLLVNFSWTNSSKIQLKISHKLSPFSKSIDHVGKHCS